MVLGFPWLKIHNPQISVWSPFCLFNCLQSAPFPEKDPSILVTKKPLDLPTVSQNYHNLCKVFSKELAFSLPPNCPYDCPIDLFPGALSPTSHYYNLSRPEREAIETYLIKNSLAAAVISPSSSTGAGFFLFVCF